MDKICDIEQLATLVDRIHEAHSQLRMAIDKPPFWSFRSWGPALNATVSHNNAVYARCLPEEVTISGEVALLLASNMSDVNQKVGTLSRDSDSWGSIASLVGSMLAAGFAPNAVTVSKAGRKIYDTFASTTDYNKKYWEIHEHLNPVLWSFLMLHRVQNDAFLL